MSITSADLIGAWELVDFRITFDDERAPVAPFGDDARGQLIYTAAGQMSAVLSAGERARLSVDGLERASTAPIAEKAAAFDSYLSYSGTYSIRDGSVVHRVELALVPNIIGNEQVRQARLDGDELWLTYDRDTARGPQHYALRWRRA